MQTSVPMSTESKVPPGFRFHPTDEELVDYYLKKKVDSQRIDLDVIREINLYKIEPWDLQETCRIGSTDQDEWYFFSHKDKKYPTGTRTNRATAAGFWKATGRDKAIYSKHKLVGMRKTLVFYRGRAPNGQKTDWIMHEYRLENCENGCTSQTSEEGWAVCRVFRKRSPNIKRMHEGDPASCCYDEQMSLLAEFDSPKHGLHDDPMYHQPFSCKQELDQFVEYHLSHDPFLQLPQLESPKITCFASTSNVRSMIMENTRRNEYQIPNFGTMDAVNFEMNTDQLTSSADTPGTIPSNTATLNKEEQVMDWRVLDRLVASQLSQEDTPKEIRFPSSVGACLGQQNKQQITTAPNYNPNNDIDLWSLAKRDFSSR